MKLAVKKVIGACKELGKSNTTHSQVSEPLVWSKELLMSLDWRRFEELCEWYFQERNFQTKATAAGADGGIDIELYRAAHSLKDPIGLVQCKRQIKPVELKSVRNFAGAMNMKGVDHGVFITSGEFKPAAHKEIEQGKIKLALWTGKEFLENILKLPTKEHSYLLEKTTKGNFTTPTCVRCNTKMVERENKKTTEKFWGCSNYPKCRSIQNIAGEKERAKAAMKAKA